MRQRMALCGLALIAAASLAGCSQPSPGNAVADASSDAANSSVSGGARTLPPGVAPWVAYSYAYNLTASSARILDLQAKHQHECEAAGPAACQVTAADSDNQPGSAAHATLTLRATTTWMATFRDSLAADAKAVNGRIVKASTTTEDMARPIADTETAIRNKTNLRNREETAAAHDKGKTESVQSAAQTAANAQQDLDDTTSALAAAQARVNMPTVTLDYQGTDASNGENVWSPIGVAFQNFGKAFALVVAGIVYIVAAVSPFALLIGAGVLGYRVWRKWRAGKKAKSEALPSR